MAYTKTAWVDGSAPAISAANLGKIESALEKSVGVDSLSDLKALPVPTSALAARMLGHTSPSDEADGVWWWDAASSEADNVGTVVIPNSSPASGRWKRLHTGSLNVRWFGAKGDGSTDDTATIQAAIDTANADGGGVVLVPRSATSYKVNALTSLVLKSNVTLWIEPGATIEAITNNAEAYNIIKCSDATDIAVLGGGTIKGDRATHTGTTGESGHGIAFFGATRFRIEGLTIKDCWGDGIYIKNHSDGTTPSKDGRIVGNTCDNNRRQGCSIIALHRGYIAGNSFINTNGTAPQAGLDLEPNTGRTNKHLAVIGNLCRNNTGAGILVYTNLTTKTAISGNVCAENDIGIRLGHATDISVTGNYCTDNTNEGIKLDALSGSADLTFTCSVVGNHCQGGTYGINLESVSGKELFAITVHGNFIYTPSVHGIVTNYLDEASITGNTVINAARRAIFLQNSTHITVNNNTIRRSGEEAIMLSAGSNRSAIVGNGAWDCCNSAHDTYPAIHTVGAGANNIQNNTVRTSQANKPKYGIQIADNDNLVTNNDVYLGFQTQGVNIGGATTGNVQTAGNRV